MTFKPIAALALCGLLLAAGARAAAAAPPSRHRHHRENSDQVPRVPPTPVLTPDVFLLLPYDADHDHRITKSELNAAIAGNWRDLAGSRTSVRLLELQDWFTKVEGSAVTPFNPLEFKADGGDSIIRDEFARALTARFNALDRNGDGVLEPSELNTIVRARQIPQH
jgi:hypothetical protein